MGKNNISPSASVHFPHETAITFCSLKNDFIVMCARELISVFKKQYWMRNPVIVRLRTTNDKYHRGSSLLPPESCAAQTERSLRRARPARSLPTRPFPAFGDRCRATAATFLRRPGDRPRRAPARKCPSPSCAWAGRGPGRPPWRQVRGRHGGAVRSGSGSGRGPASRRAMGGCGGVLGALPRKKGPWAKSCCSRGAARFSPCEAAPGLPGCRPPGAWGGGCDPHPLGRRGKG